MDFLNTLTGWAKSAWGAIFGAAQDIPGALTKFWSYVTSLHSLVSWLFGFPLLQLVRALLGHSGATSDSLAALLAALRRLPGWIWAHEVKPVRDELSAWIRSVRDWAAHQILMLWMTLESDFSFALAFTVQQVGIERAQRTAAVDREHYLMMARVTWALQQVQQQASSGYNSVTAARKDLIRTLLADVAERDPAVKGLVSDLATLIIDIDTVDNPVARYAISHLLNDVIAHLGIDQAITNLIQRLIGPLAGDPRPATLHDVEKDVAERLNALEAQWAQFMADGGPEVEQAGGGWKDMTGLAVDAAALAFFGLAVTNPSAWATGVADTIGVAAGDAMTGIVDLIGKV